MIFGHFARGPIRGPRRPCSLRRSNRPLRTGPATCPRCRSTRRDGRECRTSAPCPWPDRPSSRSIARRSGGPVGAADVVHSAVAGDRGHDLDADPLVILADHPRFAGEVEIAENIDAVLADAGGRSGAHQRADGVAGRAVAVLLRALESLPSGRAARGCFFPPPRGGRPPPRRRRSRPRCRSSR